MINEGGESNASEKWIDCEFIRFLQRDACVIRILETGALVQVGLSEPLDLTRACVVSALYPVPARVMLGDFSKGCFKECKLEINWQDRCVMAGPPTRYVKKARKQQGLAGVHGS